MISKNLQKYIHSLELKKYRTRESVFVAEGPKVIGDLLSVFEPAVIVGTEEWLHAHADGLSCEIQVATDEELRKLSFLQHPQQVLAVLKMPQGETNSLPDTSQQLVLALDNVQDPGNMGTIIRIADWFGIEHIVCQTGSADVYNPKVVQATMGSLARVRVNYTELTEWLGRQPKDVPVYGTLLDGQNIYEQPLSHHGIIIMGNEGNGISQEVRPFVSHRLLIPNYPQDRETAESLNVAVATALTCAEFRRRCAE
jgi:TrmH family RNA methyltransferase